VCREHNHDVPAGVPRAAVFKVAAARRQRCVRARSGRGLALEGHNLALARKAARDNFVRAAMQCCDARSVNGGCDGL